MDKKLHPHCKYSLDGKSHCPQVQAVLESLKKEKFTINLKKCAIAMVKVRYPRYIGGRGLVETQMIKVKASQAWPCTVTKKQVQAFLGIVRYYHQFFLNFATIAVPLTDLTKGSKYSMSCSSVVIRLKKLF